MSIQPFLVLALLAFASLPACKGKQAVDKHPTKTSVSSETTHDQSTAILLHTPAPTGTGNDGGLTIGEMARLQAEKHGKHSPDCAMPLRYSVRWADRLPPELPVYPDAKVVEAAGNEAPGCRLRVVSFTTDAPLNIVLDYYYTLAVRGGFSAEHRLGEDRSHILGGERASDGTAYYLNVAPHAGGGSEADIILNNGR